MSVTTIPGTEVSVSNRDGISSEITANKDVETVLHNSARERVVLEELMQELHHCKTNNEALRDQIHSQKVVLDERNQMLRVLEKNLDEIRSENHKVANALGNGRGS